MKIKINGNTHDIPTSWKEVTFGQFLRLSEAGQDSAMILSIFTGIEEDIIRSSKIKGIEGILQALGFMSGKLATDIPKTCMGFKVPPGLEFETIGQFEDIKSVFDEIKSTDTENIKRYTELVAIYAVTPYDSKKAEELAPMFMDAPCEEVMAIGNFTAMKLIELNLSIKVNTQNRQDTRLKKLKLVLKAWLNNLAFSIRFYLWKRKLHITETSLKSGQ